VLYTVVLYVQYSYMHVGVDNERRDMNCQNASFPPHVTVKLS